MVKKDILLEIDGLGVIMYSPDAVSFIQENEDYLTTKYLTAKQVSEHVNAGTIIGLGTGSPGTYILKIRSGYPDEAILDSSDYVLRLGIKVNEGTVYFRDLYDLMEWTSECPNDQSIQLEDGNYHVTVYSNLPQSKIRGDGQEIHIFFKQLDAFPAIKYNGVPTLD